MIEYLRGQLLRIDEEDHIVVDVNGVGYGLDVPRSTLERLPALGEEAELHVSFLLREDSIRLFGFATKAEKTVFEIFLNVSGIGPRTALDVLSAISIREIVSAIRLENVALLTGIPGIGRKKAERLIVELKDRVKLFPDVAGETSTETRTGAGGLPTRAEGDLYEDAVAALQSLGLKPAVAARNVTLALRSVDKENVSVEEIVKLALQTNR